MAELISRRAFSVSGGALAAGAALFPAVRTMAAVPITTGEVIARIKQNVGVPWHEQTVDKIIVGTADQPVRGIATTMMATLDVVEKAVAQGCNMIVTHEPTFYMHQDVTDDLKKDATYLYKLDFCQKHNVSVFHFHDHWHMRHPDGIAQGMINQLGWQKNVNDPADPKKLTFDGVPLARFAEEMATKLNARTMRILGDPELPVKRVQTSWGYVGREGGIQIFSQPDLDVLICGETREWEVVEYCQDTIRRGERKGSLSWGMCFLNRAG